MNKISLPAHISHTVIVHGGSYKDFLTKLADDYKGLIIRYVKRIAIHYYIVQLEDVTDSGYEKSKIYNLPIMALKEEFSSYLFFKNVKSYNNVLKRMYGGEKNTDGPFELVKDMLTPYEKLLLLNLDEVDDVIVTEETTTNGKTSATLNYYPAKKIKTDSNAQNKLFSATEIKVKGKEVDLVGMIKEKGWRIGII